MSKGYPILSAEPTELRVPFRMVGTGASAPTRQYGKGITITRTGAGVYKLTFSSLPGTFVTVTPSLQAATPADIKNHSLVWDTFDVATMSIEVSLFDASAVAHDLAALEYIGGELIFKTSSVPA